MADLASWEDTLYPVRDAFPGASIILDEENRRAVYVGGGVTVTSDRKGIMITLRGILRGDLPSTASAQLIIAAVWAIKNG